MYSRTMEIRATSYLDKVEIGKPKELFKKYNHLGVYEWKDVYKTAEYDLNREIMVFLFSKTELFKRGLKFNEINDIWRQNRSKNYYIQGPIEITHDEYFMLYKMGMKL